MKSNALMHLDMLLGLFKNVNGCLSDSPKIVYFGEFDTGAALKVKSPCNLDCADGKQTGTQWSGGGAPKIAQTPPL